MNRLHADKKMVIIHLRFDIVVVLLHKKAEIFRSDQFEISKSFYHQGIQYSIHYQCLAMKKFKSRSRHKSPYQLFTLSR